MLHTLNMYMRIHHATEWAKVGDDLKSSLNKLRYNPDLYKMHKNIGALVGELSKLEVDARRTGNANITKEKLEQINSAIDRLDKYIVMAALMQ